ncbi:serine hydroxymethyltransferase, partial [Streptomyces sp. SID2119]|nr:serine hydroxymethyltransferase [Streptomyces sp. SID2119]
MPVTSPAAPAPVPAAVPAASEAPPQDFGALLRQDPEIAGVLLGERDRQAATLQ